MDFEAPIQRFRDHFPAIIKWVRDGLEELRAPSDAIEWVVKAVEYTVPGGKMLRGSAVVITTTLLDPSGSHLDSAIVLGWCIEILQACFLIADDVMDQSITRRGQPCWYKKVGLAAVNDALLLQSIVYRLLKQHFASDPSYLKQMELFLEITFQTEIGQLLDLTTLPTEEGVDKLKNFTFDRYREIINKKTAFYSFVLPVHAALILNGCEDELAYEESEACLLDLGEFFQIQDDYLDFYGDPSTTGKVGTDIEEGKCTWLALRCLASATAQQKRIFTESIGVPNRRHFIAEMYWDMNLDLEFKNYEAAFQSKFAERLAAVKCQQVKQIVEVFAKMIFHRRK